VLDGVTFKDRGKVEITDYEQKDEKVVA